MKILLCNDDGYDAAGLLALRDECLRAGHDVCVVAPGSERSASSHSISWKTPISMRKRSDRLYVVEGTPADCARLGLLEAFPEADIVLSGINVGYNTGKDTIYSGTVAGAMEGVLLGKPALAVSLEWKRDAEYKPAASIAVQMLAHFMQNPMPVGTMCNLNVPALPYEQIKGIRLAELYEGSVLTGFAKYESEISGTWYYTRMNEHQPPSPSSDRGLADEGYATVTYLSWRLSVNPPENAIPELTLDGRRV